MLAIALASVLIGGCGRAAPEAKPPLVAADAVTSDATEITAEVSPPHASPGGAVTLALRFRIAAGWHISPIEHASNPPQPSLPVEIDLQLPKGISAMEGWIVPEAQLQFGPNGPTQGYAGNVAFKRRLRIDQHASPGPVEVRCTIGYQICNASLCTRPAPVELKATVDVGDE